MLDQVDSQKRSCSTTTVSNLSCLPHRNDHWITGGNHVICCYYSSAGIFLELEWESYLLCRRILKVGGLLSNYRGNTRLEILTVPAELIKFLSMYGQFLTESVIGLQNNISPYLHSIIDVLLSTERAGNYAYWTKMSYTAATFISFFMPTWWSCQ